MTTGAAQKTSRPRLGVGRLAILGLGVGSLIAGFTVVTGVNPAGAVGTTRYVSPSGSDASNNCTVKVDPCQTLKHANNVAGNGDTILLSPGTFVGNITISHFLSIQGTLATGSLDATNTTINGEAGKKGAVTLEIDPGVTVSISNLVINGADEIVGGIYNDGGNLTLTNVSVEDNMAVFGAGIFNIGVLVMNGGLISGNTAFDGGEGAGLFNDGSAQLHSVAFNHDVATGSGAEGGAIFDVDALQLTGTTPIHNNSASFDGGGIEVCSKTFPSLGPGTSVTANTPNNIGTAC